MLAQILYVLNLDMLSWLYRWCAMLAAPKFKDIKRYLVIHAPPVVGLSLLCNRRCDECVWLK